ncbi:MAG: sialate O-acetylesterase [Verrucomicrobia bacterium]|nr:sialate O-acetylesterase [Verrucomicrobiota bacterium]
MKTFIKNMRRSRFPFLFLVCLLETRSALALINVNCVGDSITFGSGLATTAETYPFKLQQLLGPAYSVANYGVSGATLLKAGDSPYWGTSAYTFSHGIRGGQIPNIVILMLGSNDAKPQNWQFSGSFIQDYTNLVASYANLTTHPRILVCTPPPVFGSGAFNINPGVVETNIAPLVRQLSLALDRELIDMNSIFAGHPELFPDTVHPNSDGATAMASLVYTAIVPEPGSASLFGFGLLILLRGRNRPGRCD